MKPKYSRIRVHPPQHERRMSITALFRRWNKPYEATQPSSMLAWRYEREFARMHRTKPRRTMVGMLRAMTDNPHLFHGAHFRAEYD